MLAETFNAGLLRQAAEKKNDERILMQIRGKDCVALEVRYHKVCYGNYTKFLTRELKENKPSASVYEKSYDVFYKEVVEKEVIVGKKVKYMKELIEKFITIAKNTENIDASNYRAFKLKQRLRKTYPQLVFCTPKTRNVSEIVYVENLNCSELVEEHMFHKHENDDGEDCTSEEENNEESNDTNTTTSTSANSQVNELQILFNAALILGKKIMELPKLNLPWPPLASDLTTENAKKSVPCELFNMLAWVCNLSSEPTLSGHVTLDDKKNAKLMSITQDLVNLSSGGKNPTPKSIALAMALRQLTGSSSVISLLNGLGHCMSHSFVLNHETALAQLNISRDSAIPPGFISNTPTILVWDNNDFSEETRSGKGTTHITGGIIIQDEEFTGEIQKRESIPRSRSLPAPSKDIDPYFLGKRRTVNLNNAIQSSEIDEEKHISPQNDGKKKDLAYCLCRYVDRSFSLPNWTGFNTKLTRSIPKQCKVGYMPVIDASPTELATVKEILNRCEEIADKLNLRHIFLVFDEAIFAKVQQIRWREKR